jgi:phage FluMu gp28-like protein
MSAIDLYSYQKAWILDKSRFKIGMQARQTGKTFETTLEIVDNCFEFATQGRKTKWIILSKGERQAKEIIKEGITPHAHAFNIGAKETAYEWDSGQGVYNVLEVSLAGGSRIIALPANPDTARGFAGNVYLDEFALHRDSREIWGALYPVISAGYKIRITSTPKGKSNKFYEIFTSEGDLWSKHRTDIYEAVAAGLPRDIEELRDGLNDADLWRQEYELQWLDEAEAWLPYELINSVEDDRAGIPQNYQGGKCFIGNDIGRKNDLWVSVVWESIGDVLWCREIKTLKRTSFADQDKALDSLMDNYDVVRIALDQTGMGEKPVEDAERRYGRHKVEGVMFTLNSKQHMANLGKQYFEERKIRIPLGDTALREDLHKLRRIITPIGNIRFDADRDSSGHADRTWAAFLGIYAASTTERQVKRSPVGSMSRPNYG